jgi:hypothetical protein
MRLSSIRVVRRAIPAVVTLALAGAGALSTGGPAAAATYGSYGSSGATSYGFVCNSTYHWVRENWPNIQVAGSANQNVYVRTFLYRWNGSGWPHVRTGAWYNGVSNNQGRKALGTLGREPYYFATMTSPTGVAPELGEVFTNLTPGYYRTVEQYYTQGSYWSADTTYAGTTNVTYCQA